MGQWPFGNQLSEEEKLMQEVMDVLFSLECALDYELDWMDRIEEQENEVDNDDDSEEEDLVSEDERYNTSPEVDFEAFDFWVLGLNKFLGELNYM